MPVKIIELPEIGKVSLYKRKGAKTMRLSIKHSGEIRLSMPRWAPYNAGILYIQANINWINDHKVQKMPDFKNNLRVGKAHTLIYKTSLTDKITTRIKENLVIILVPENTNINSTEVQLASKKACQRALKKEAERLLPRRLKDLANKYNFTYKGIKIRNLKSRWGSCNNYKEITLSFYLMQLPWELIDYVILHELTHTKVLSHNARFWEEFTNSLPNAKELRNEINNFKPIINTSL